MDADTVAGRQEQRDRLTFLVQGSEPDPYRCEFERAGDRMSARCSCAAGAAGQACKHRLRLLAGDDTSMVSGTAEDLAALRQLLTGTRLAQALDEWMRREAEAAEAKARVSQAKHNLSRIMHEAL